MMSNPFRITKTSLREECGGGSQSKFAQNRTFNSIREHSPNARAASASSIHPRVPYSNDFSLETREHEGWIRWSPYRGPPRVQAPHFETIRDHLNAMRIAQVQQQLRSSFVRESSMRERWGDKECRTRSACRSSQPQGCRGPHAITSALDSKQEKRGTAEFLVPPVQRHALTEGSDFVQEELHAFEKRVCPSSAQPLSSSRCTSSPRTGSPRSLQWRMRLAAGSSFSPRSKPAVASPLQGTESKGKGSNHDDVPRANLNSMMPAVAYLLQLEQARTSALVLRLRKFSNETLMQTFVQQCNKYSGNLSRVQCSSFNRKGNSFRSAQNLPSSNSAVFFSCEELTLTAPQFVHWVHELIDPVEADRKHCLELYGRLQYSTRSVPKPLDFGCFFTLWHMWFGEDLRTSAEILFSVLTRYFSLEKPEVSDVTPFEIHSVIDTLESIYQEWAHGHTHKETPSLSAPPRDDDDEDRVPPNSCAAFLRPGHPTTSTPKNSSRRRTSCSKTMYRARSPVSPSHTDAKHSTDNNFPPKIAEEHDWSRGIASQRPSRIQRDARQSKAETPVRESALLFTAPALSSIRSSTRTKTAGGKVASTSTKKRPSKGSPLLPSSNLSNAECSLANLDINNWRIFIEKLRIELRSWISSVNFHSYACSVDINTLPRNMDLYALIHSQGFAQFSMKIRQELRNVSMLINKEQSGVF